MIPRPSLRLPIWAAIAIVLAAYAVRSLVLREGDFSPDMPGDAIAGVTLLVAIALVAYSRHRRSSEDEPGHDDGRRRR